MMKPSILLSAALFTAATPALAADKNWSGAGELGYTTSSTAAKTESESLTAKLGINYKKDVWGNELKLENLKSESTDATGTKSETANRSTISDKVTYDFNETLYTWGSLRYEDDELSSFHYQKNLSTGLGWRAIKTDVTKLNLELGIGAQESKLRTTGDKDSGGAMRFYEDLSHKLSDTTDLTQSLLVEGNDDNLQSTLDLGMKVAISGALSLKVSHQIKHNSEVPAGVRNYDRNSSVTVVYGF